MASKRKRAPAIRAPTEQEWNSRRELICSIYCELGLPKLMDSMENEHNFIASKNQYERKLKDWGLRKNLNSKEWECIVHKKHKRENAGKKSQVTSHGVRIPNEKIKKQESRYSLAELQQIFYQGPNTPEGICVFTPPAGFEEAGARIRQVRVDNLPWFGFLNFLSSQDSSTTFSASPTKPLESWFPAESSRIFDLDEENVFPNSGDDIISSAHTIEIATTHRRLSSICPPTDNFIKGLFPKGVIDDQMTEKDRKKRILNYLGDSIPERYESDMDFRIGRLLGPSDADALSAFVELMVYMFSNNLLRNPHEKGILKWLTSQNKSFLQRIFAVKLPAMRACLDALVHIAELYRDRTAFRILFDADTDRNLYRGRRESLMLVSVKLGSAKVMEKLFEEGIDANTRMGEMWDCKFIEVAPTVEVARILLEAGADVDSSTCQHAVKTCNTALAQTLLDAGVEFDPNVDKYSFKFKWLTYYGSHLTQAILHTDLRLINLLIRAGAKFTTWELQLAIYSGSVEIVAALLDTQSSKTILRTESHRPLRTAAWLGYEQILSLLIDAGADVNASFTQSDTEEYIEDYYRGPLSTAWGPIPEPWTCATTPLLAAVEVGYTNVVRTLIENHVNVNALAFGGCGRTNVLEVAQDLGHYEIYSLLIKAGTRNLAPISRDYQIYSIYYAAKTQNLQRVQYLISTGINVCHILDVEDDWLNLEDGYLERSDNDLLAPAAKNVLSIFVKVCGDNINATGPRYGRSALELAIYSGEFTTVQELILAGASLDVPVKRYGRTNCSILEVAISQFVEEDSNAPLIELAELMLERGVLANATEDTVAAAFKAAIQSLDLELVRLFLPTVAKINMFRGHQESLACALKVDPCFEIVQFLLEHGAYVNPHRQQGVFINTPLQLAAEICGDKILETITLLLDRGAVVNPPANARYDRTPLQWTVSRLRQSLELIRLLLDHGADVNAPAGNLDDFYLGGRTALQAAVSEDDFNLDVINLLLDKGADIHAPPAKRRGVTALQGAAIWGHLKIVHMLLERGANPNAQGSLVEGRTALEGAAQYGRLDVVHILLDNGAEPSESAAEFAEKRKYFVIADIIKKRLAERENNMAA